MGKRRQSQSAGNTLIPISYAPNPAPNPAANPAPANPQMGGVDPISQVILSLNSNPYLVGSMILLLNLGGRFLSLELTKKQEEFFQQPWIRPLIFFTVIFIATRNLVVAFWVTVIFFFIIWVVANEHSPFCMIPTWCGHNTESEQLNYLKNILKL